MTKDWLHHTKMPALFSPNRLQKAFDCIEYEYLWNTFEHLGLGGKFLDLAKALAIDAYSKVHVNGLFTEYIFVTWGV